MTCWASMPTWMNYLVSKLDDMSQDEYERFQAAMENCLLIFFNFSLKF